ncbi:MAG: hypothetical protein J6T94_03435 [Bacteroidaceae bacterium]|nr:hypothetical protein [Bacteroidaceae bacterium]
MKKEYIKPELTEEVLFTQNLIAASLKDGEADDSPVLGNGRRGRWGNLWDED